jgi:PAS domain S-box-containing protein
MNPASPLGALPEPLKIKVDPASAPGQMLKDLNRQAEQLRQRLEFQAGSMRNVPPALIDGLNTIRLALEQAAPEVLTQEAELARLRALADTAELVSSSLDLTTVLNQVMDTIISLIGAERGFLMLRNERGELQLRIARGMEREQLAREDFTVSRTVLAAVAESGQPVVTTNASDDPRFSAQASVIGYNLRSIVCVPLRFKGQLTGIIYADSRIHVGLFSEKERDLLAAFAHQAAIAIENARQFAQVSELKTLLDNVFGSIASGVITTDVRDVVTLTNTAAEAILGRTKQELVGRPLGQAMPHVDDALNELMARVKRDGRPVLGHELQGDHDGRAHWRLNVSPLTPGGILAAQARASQGVVIVLDDVSEQRKLRAKYELFTRMVPPQVVERLNVDGLKLGGQRKEISVLFADIHGFTSLSESIDPEILIEALNRYVGAAAETLLAEEATVDKFVGDAVMAFFNAPDDQPDHVLRAARAALKMRNRIAAVRDDMPEAFRMQFRIGVHCGEAVVGLVGHKDRLDYTVIGDTVNTAKRIEDQGLPGTVVISDVAYQHLREYALIANTRTLQLKGRAQAVVVHELIDLR